MAKTKTREYWQSYTVSTKGEIILGRAYEPGHSMKCRWTAFVHEQEANGTPNKWWVAEDTDTRKVVAYDDKIISMVVFQLVSIDALVNPPKRAKK